MQTPWGRSDFEHKYAEGITFLGTPGHGGFYLSRERVKEVPQDYREFAAKWSKGWGDQWYEEDCAALAVIATFPEYFPDVSPDDLVALTDQLDHYVYGD